MNKVYMLIVLMLGLYGCAADPLVQPVATQQQDLQDSDNDGVINARDLCPQSPPSSLVDNNGCHDEFASQETQEMLVFFEHDSALIKAENKPHIHKLAQVLIANPQQKLLLAGHASSVGSDEYNNNLARNRALAIQKLLLDFGVKPQQLEVTSYGSFKNMVTGASKLAHSANRRVFFATTTTETNLLTKWNIFTPEMLDNFSQ